MAQHRKPKMGKPRLKVVGGDVKMATPPSQADRTYFRELHQIIDEVFQEAATEFEWTWSQLAFNAGLGYTTVANLGDRLTRWPRFSTVWRLCKAVGWDLIPKPQPKTKHVTLKLKKVS